MSRVSWFIPCLVVFAVHADVVGTVDFSRDIGKVNPALHSSGWTPRSTANAFFVTFN